MFFTLANELAPTASVSDVPFYPTILSWCCTNFQALQDIGMNLQGKSSRVPELIILDHKLCHVMCLTKTFWQGPRQIIELDAEGLQIDVMISIGFCSQR